MTKLLSCRHVDKTYPADFFGNRSPVHALRDVSLEVGQGQVIALMGESGCGKSTLARAITKLIDVDAGEILFQGQDITKLSQRAFYPMRKDIGMIFQDTLETFDPRRPVGWSIAQAGINKSGASREQAVAQAFEKMSDCGLVKVMYDRYPHELSGGQRQRAAIARALMGSPKLLLADEAVSALDRGLQCEITALIAQLVRQKGMGCLWITHELDLAQRFCDEVIIMAQGQIIDGASVNKVK